MSYYEIRVYGKNRKNTPSGVRSYWTDIDGWRERRLRETGRYPVTVNVTTQSPGWSRFLSPMCLGPVETYMENEKLRTAVSVEVAWQYSKVYREEKFGNDFRPLEFIGPDGNPTERWFAWRDQAWSNEEFSFGHQAFDDNKSRIRRAYPKGSPVGFWYWNGLRMDQITSRREIYARLYCQEVRKTESYERIQEIFAENDLIIYDIDGYDYLELGMTPEDTVRDLGHSWGHGLVLSLMLKGIDPVALGGKSDV